MGQHQARHQHMQQVNILVDNDIVQHVLHYNRRRYPQGLDDQSGHQQIHQQGLVGFQITHKALPGRGAGGDLHHLAAGREQQGDAGPALLETRPVHLDESQRRIGHPDLVFGHTVDHDVVVALPMGDKGQLESQQRIVIALHAAGGEAQGLTDLRQTVQGGPFRGHIGHFPQFPPGNVELVVAADHGQAGSTAVLLFRLLDQGKTADKLLSELRFGAQVEHQGLPAPLRDLALALELTLGLAHPLF